MYNRSAIQKEMMLYLITTNNEIVLARFLLSMNVENFAVALGGKTNKPMINAAKKGHPSKALSYAVSYLVTEHQDSEYIEHLLRQTDADRYVDFLRSLTKHNQLPNFSLQGCDCHNPQINYEFKQGRDRTHLITTCATCNSTHDCQKMADYRAHQIQLGEIDLFAAHNYRFPLWVSNRVRVGQ